MSYIELELLTFGALSIHMHVCSKFFDRLYFRADLSFGPLRKHQDKAWNNFSRPRSRLLAPELVNPQPRFANHSLLL